MNSREQWKLQWRSSDGYALARSQCWTTTINVEFMETTTLLGSIPWVPSVSMGQQPGTPRCHPDVRYLDHSQLEDRVPWNQLCPTALYNSHRDPFALYKQLSSTTCVTTIVQTFVWQKTTESFQPKSDEFRYIFINGGLVTTPDHFGWHKAQPRGLQIST